MSDFEESDENESGEDFSASEDDWQPEKEIDSGDSEDEDVFEEDETTLKTDNNTKKSTIKKQSSKARNKKVASNSLRAKLFRKYRPPPKTVKPTSPSKEPLPPRIVSILSNSQFTKPKAIGSSSSSSIARNNVESDSSSSDEDGLVNPADLDFSQIAASAAIANKDVVPVFDCNAGVKLSDSDEENEEDEGEEIKDEESPLPDTQNKIVNPIISKINKKSSNEVRDFSDLQTFHKNLESAKKHLTKLCEDQKKSSDKSTNSNDDDTDVTKLLSLGEGIPQTSDSQSKRKRKKHQRDSDDSDWENVSGEENNSQPKTYSDIQITVGDEIVRREKTKKAIDLEACIKRRLNREIKERQIFVHKASFLGWVSHGNYINRFLNNQFIMELCLKLLPSKNAYPDGDTDTKYFTSFTKWFNSVFELKSKKMYCDFKPLPPKLKSLALQIQSKKIICKKDYVLVFVSMLRAIGIQCRLVLNLPVAPLRPPQSELLVVSTKAKTEEHQPSTSKSSKDHDHGKSMAKLNDTNKKKKKTWSIDQKVQSAIDKIKKKESPSKHTSSSNSDSPEKKTNDSKKTSSTKSKASLESKNIRNEKTPEKAPTKYPNISEKEQKSSKIQLKNLSDPNKKTDKKLEKSETKSPINSSSTKKTSTSKKSADKVNDREKLNSHPLPKEKPQQRTSKRKIEAAGSAPPVKLPKEYDPTSSSLLLKKNKNVQRAIQSESCIDMYSPRKTRSQRRRAIEKLKMPQFDGVDDSAETKNTRSKRSLRSKPVREDSDSDFAPPPPKVKAPKSRKSIKSPYFAENDKPKSKLLDKVKRVDLRVLSTDEEDADVISNTNKETTIDAWIEVFNEKDKKWIIIDPVKNKIDATDHVRKFATKPLTYVFAWNNDNSIRDVTPRYSNHFHTAIRKQRAEQEWLDKAMRRFIESRNARTIIEDVEFSKLQIDTPLPTSISEFKNHPLYALERHLLKFEAIYPPNPLTLGYIRGEPVYPRECVHTLHSREIWVKQARTVKIGEKPYKIVKARPKWDRMLNQMQEALPLEIFGAWQTQPYEPPVAENGIVPRNPYGNVELFKPEMLPIGTRHIQLPSLNRVCKKMNVDCAQAVVGFDFHSGSSHPTFDGFVVCEEFADAVIAKWYEDQEEQEEKERKKYEARVYGNWKKLIKGLYIRQRLKNKYNFGDKTK